MFDPVLATAPDREALVTRSGRWTYSALDRLADAAGAVLAGLGVGPGDRVAAALPNDVDVVAAFHGAMRIGAVWVGINRALAPPEKAYLLSDSGAIVLLCDPDTAAQLEPLAGQLTGLRRTLVVEPADPAGEWRGAPPAAGAPRPPPPRAPPRAAGRPPAPAHPPRRRAPPPAPRRPPPRPPATGESDISAVTRLHLGNHGEHHRTQSDLLVHKRSDALLDQFPEVARLYLAAAQPLKRPHHALLGAGQ